MVKKLGKILATAFAFALVCAACFAIAGCGGEVAEKEIKVVGINSYAEQINLGFDGGIEDMLYTNVLEIYSDGTYKLTVTVNGYARWVNMLVVSNADVVFGTWTESEDSDEFSLFATLSAPTRVISYSNVISNTEANPPMDSASADISEEKRTELLSKYKEQAIELVYETGNYSVAE